MEILCNKNKQTKIMRKIKKKKKFYEKIFHQDDDTSRNEYDKL